MSAWTLATPASANFVAGGGVAFGEVDFGTTSIPSLMQGGCNPVAWSFDTAKATANATAAAFVSLGGNAFAGLMRIQAHGSNGCEFVQQGNGPLSVTYAFGTNATGLGYFTCNTMAGQYNRLGNIVLLGVSAPCQVTGAPQGTLIANTVGVLQPTQGDGVTTNITKAAFAGAWNAVNPNP
jgi:hypothetical protein